MKKSQRISSLFGVVLIGISLSNQAVLANAQDDTPSRDVFIVYDNSGSMYQLDNSQDLNDAWSKAKYSMEVFAGMLSEDDKMNIYYMSDYDTDMKADARIQLDGDENKEKNIATIHNTKTDAGYTSFDSVRKAMSDLEQSSADEKWLVILTDGKMQNYQDGNRTNLNSKQIQDYLNQKPEEISVIFLGMGPEAEAIQTDAGKNIFYQEAKTTKDILDAVTEIGLQVFNSNRLEVDKRKQSVSFDVPMKELLVFAQGEGVEIQSITDQDGQTYQPDGDPVEVRYSDVDAPNHPDNKPDTSLQGQMALFTGPFEPGSMTINAENAKTLEVYYKPYVDIAVGLYDDSGREVTGADALEGGNYTLSFGLVNAITGEQIEKTDLLGDISYEAVVNNNGKELSGIYGNNDQIKLEEGDLSIDVTAHYLDYNTAHTQFDYEVMTDKAVTFELVDNPDYSVTTRRIQTEDGTAAAEEPIQLQALLDGQKPTAEQWALMELPAIRQVSDSKAKLEDWCIEKTQTPGLYTFYPQLPESGPTGGEYYEPVEYQVDYNQAVGPAAWQGRINETLHLTDSRAFWQVHPWRTLFGVLTGLILLFLLLYRLKKRLPKSLKDQPQVTIADKKNYGKTATEYGQVERHGKWTPIVAETATIHLLPKTMSGVSPMNVKAVKDGILVTNAGAFKDMKIGNKTMEDFIQHKNKGRKKYANDLILSGTETLKLDKEDKTYTFQLNKGQANKKSGRGGRSSGGRNSKNSSRSSSRSASNRTRLANRSTSSSRASQSRPGSAGRSGTSHNSRRGR